MNLTEIATLDRALEPDHTLGLGGPRPSRLPAMVSSLGGIPIEIGKSARSATLTVPIRYLQTGIDSTELVAGLACSQAGSEASGPTGLLRAQSSCLAEADAGVSDGPVNTRLQSGAPLPEGSAMEPFQRFLARRRVPARCGKPLKRLSFLSKSCHHRVETRCYHLPLDS